MTVRILFRWLRHLVTLVVLLVIGALLLLGVGTHLVLSRVDLRAVEAQLSTASALEAHVGGITTDWKGLVLLKDLRLELNGRPVLKTREAGLRVAFWQLSATHPDVLFLRLASPTLTLDATTVRYLSEHFRSHPPVASPLRVVLRHGSLLAGNRELRNLYGLLTISPDRVPFQLSGDDAEGGRYTARGELTRAGFSCQGNVTNVSLRRAWQVHLPAEVLVSGPFTAAGGETGADVALNWTVQDSPLASHLSGGARLGTDGALEADLTATQGRLPALGTYRWLTASIEVKAGETSIKRAHVALPSQEVDLSGTLSADGRADFHLVSSEGFSATVGGQYPALVMKGSGRLSGFDVQLEAHQRDAASAIVDRLDMSNQLGHVGLMGTVSIAPAGDADIELEVDGQSNGQTPNLPAWLPPAHLLGHVGVRYAPDERVWTAHLTTEKLQCGGESGDLTLDARYVPFADLNATVHLDVSGAPAGGVADVQALWSPSSDPLINFSVSRPRWNTQGLLPFNGSVTLHSPTVHVVLNIPDVIPGLQVAGDVDTGRMTMDFSAELKGEEAEMMASLVSTDLPVLHGNLYGTVRVQGPLAHPGLHFDGSLVHGTLGRLALGDSQISLSRPAAPDVTMRLDASTFPLQELHSVHSLLPELEGVGTAHFTTRGRGQPSEAVLDFPATTWQDRPLGPLRGHLIRQQGVVRAEGVTLPFTTPPLVVSGTWNEGTQTVDFSGTANGQSFSDLAAFFPAAPNGLSGRLYGAWRVSGPRNTPRWHFAGSGQGLTLKGVAVGAGHVEIDLAYTGSGWVGTARVGVGTRMQTARWSGAARPQAARIAR